MRFIKKNIFLASVIFLWNCSNSTSETDELIPEALIEADTLKSDTIPAGTINETTFAIEGMLLVASTTEEVLLGTNDKTTLESETP